MQILSFRNNNVLGDTRVLKCKTIHNIDFSAQISVLEAAYFLGWQMVAEETQLKWKISLEVVNVDIFISFNEYFHHISITSHFFTSQFVQIHFCVYDLQFFSKHRRLVQVIIDITTLVVPLEYQRSCKYSPKFSLETIISS